MIFDPRWLPLLLAEISYGKRKGIDKRGSICMKFSTTGQEKGDLLIQLTA
jgi:hypothetical protein